MSVLGGDGQPTQEQLAEMQAEMERDREERNMAQNLASSAAMDQPAAAPGYWDVIGQPHIGRDFEDDGIEEFTATEFSRMFALGNISRADWQSWNWRVETEFWTMKNEFIDQDSNMGDDDLRIMYGEDRPVMDNEAARRLRGASQVKKLMTSLSVDARGLRSGTEIHAVAKQESGDEPDEEDGRLSGVKNWLSG